MTIDNERVIEDLYSMHLWGGDHLPYQDLIRMLKQESGSTSSLYDIAVHIKKINEG